MCKRLLPCRYKDARYLRVERGRYRGNLIPGYLDGQSHVQKMTACLIAYNTAIPQIGKHRSQIRGNLWHTPRIYLKRQDSWTQLEDGSPSCSFCDAMTRESGHSKTKMFLLLRTPTERPRNEHKQPTKQLWHKNFGHAMCDKVSLAAARIREVGRVLQAASVECLVLSSCLVFAVSHDISHIVDLQQLPSCS